MADLSREQIMTGAYIAASPESNGLTPDEVADGLLEAQKKKEARNAAHYREAMLRRQANESAVGRDADEYLADAANFESKGRFEQAERYPDPFGIPVSPADPVPPDSISKEADKRRERGQYVIVDRGRGKEKVWRERPGLTPGDINPLEPAVREQLFSEPKYVGGRPKDDLADPWARHDAAPVGIGMGGPQGLATKLADMVVRGEISENDLLPGSTTRTVGSLIQEMAMTADPALALEADRRIAAQTAERNNARFSPAVRAINDQKAERRFVENIANIDNGLSSIQNIQSLGIASKKFNRGSNMSVFNVIPNADGDVTDRDGGINQMDKYFVEIGEDLPEGMAPELFGTDTGARVDLTGPSQADAIRMVGPDGQTVGYMDGKGQWIADVDLTPRAPLTKTQQWLEANLPDMGRQGGTSFGYPQVNIGDELALLNQRLGANAPQGGIRSLEDLENTFVRMIDSKLDGGGALFRYDPETNKSVAVSDPGIGEVLYKLGYTQNETTRLANSFQQLEAARRSPVNQEFKMLYENGMYDPRGQFAANNYGNDVAIQRVKNEKVEGKTVRGQLKALDGKSEVSKDRNPRSMFGTTPDGQRVQLPEFQQDLVDAQEALGNAQKPFIGAPAGSPAPKASFIRGNARGQSRSELIKRMPAERADQALGVERRFLEDERRRRSPEPADPQREAIKARDAAIGAEGAKRKQRDIENKARGVKPVRATPQPYDANKIKSAVAKTDGSKPKFQREMEARIVAQAQAQEGLGAQLDLRAAGVANPQRATSAVTSPAPDPTPLQIREGWAGKQLPPGQRGGALAIRGEAAMRRSPKGRLADNRIERVNIEVDKPVTQAPRRINAQRSAPTARPRERRPSYDSPVKRNDSRTTSGANTARNKLIKNILGYGGLGAGSVAAGMGIRGAYDASQQERDQEVYQ